MLLGSWDMTTNTMNYLVQGSGYVGVSASLVRDGSPANHMYLGGNFEVANNQWDMAIIRFNPSSPTTDS